MLRILSLQCDQCRGS